MKPKTGVINNLNQGETEYEDRWEYEEIIGHRTNPKIQN